MMSTPRVIYGRRSFPLGLAARGSADPSPKARFWEQHPAIEMLPAFAVVALSEDNECNRDLSPLETDCLSGVAAPIASGWPTIRELLQRGSNHPRRAFGRIARYMAQNLRSKCSLPISSPGPGKDPTANDQSCKHRSCHPGLRLLR